MTTAGHPRPRRARASGSLVVAVITFLALAGCMIGDPEVTASSQDAHSEVVTGTAAPSESPVPGQEPMVTTAPDQYSQVGDLVEGFPIDLLPVPADAVILVTSAVPVGDADDVQEVSLNLRTTTSAQDLLEFYRRALTKAGFSEVTDQTSDSDLAVDVTFVRSGGDELISIGVLDTNGARTVTIGGRVRT